VVSRDCGRWTLLMRWTKPVSLAWVPSSLLARTEVRADRGSGVPVR
jgi:hypothetical protein